MEQQKTPTPTPCPKCGKLPIVKNHLALGLLEYPIYWLACDICKERGLYVGVGSMNAITTEPITHNRQAIDWAVIAWNTKEHKHADTERGYRMLTRFDYTDLTHRITDKYGNIATFAVAMGKPTRSIINKLANRQQWKQSEILQACNVLGINECDIDKYFFSE